jgi:hypothetical protein
MNLIKEKYSNDWIEHIINNIKNYKIDIGDILQNKLLTEEVYNNLKIRIEKKNIQHFCNHILLVHVLTHFKII